MTPTEHPETVVIDGHHVPAHQADLFYNADDGSRITDEQWDESKRRVAEAEADGDEVPTWEAIE